MTQKKITQKDYINDSIPFEPYIRESDLRLKSDEYIIIHLDGVHFTSKYYKLFNNEQKADVFKCIVESGIELCKYFKSAKLAYVYGDEFSVLLKGDAVNDNYHNRIQKLCSIASGFLSVNLVNRLKPLCGDADINNFSNACFFAAKAYNLPSHMINDYFKWRLAGCKKLILDKHQDFDSKPDWEKYGELIIFNEGNWRTKCLDFRSCKFVKTPQCDYFTLKS